MASLYIKDAETTQEVTRLAKELGVTKTEVVRLGLRAIARQRNAEGGDHTFADRYKAYRVAHPLPPLTGSPPDKAFYDRLSGEEDLHDPFC